MFLRVKQAIIHDEIMLLL